MSKRAIIGLSIMVFIVILASILFGVVFCLRNQTVKVLGETPISIPREDIIETAGLENGSSIFMLDKEKAIRNIEAKFSHIKVVQIKTTSLTEIQICVRARHEMFYVEANDKYYVMDEDLKVLDILDKTAGEQTNLIKIEAEGMDISAATMTCDFVGSKEQRDATYNLFVAMTTVVTKEDNDEEYLSRDDIKAKIDNIKLEKFETYNKILITTSYGVVLDIENPQTDMQNKINICFSAIKQFIADENDKEKSGTIKIYYNAEGALTSVYIPQI